MPVRLTEKSRVLIELPLMLFLRLADADGKMTALEMERFDTLIAERDWCRSIMFRKALSITETEKGALWRRYVVGEFRAGCDGVAASLDTVLRSATPEERPDIEHDILYLCRELLKTAHKAAGFLCGDASSLAGFDAIFELVRLPSARAAAMANTPAFIAPRIVLGNSAALLSAEVGADMFQSRGKLSLRCVHIVDETHDVKTFDFVAEPEKLFRYQPGQFITLEIPIENKIVRRSYTISSSPSRPYSISVTVKRAEGGLISNWLHDKLNIGVALFATGPNGKFTCTGDEAAPYLFISGGSGVTPVMSMARWLRDTAPGADIRFLHFARSADDFIFGRELRVIERELPNFRCDLVCGGQEEGAGWNGRVGRISRELLEAMIPDLSSRRIYLCGPVSFMAATRTILEQLSFDMNRFRQESFGGLPREAKLLAADASQAATVSFSASRVVVACKSTDYLLDLAIDQGLEVAFSCRAGQCGSCKATLLEGSVEHDCADALSDDDLKNGLILLCQARPTGNIVVDQ